MSELNQNPVMDAKTELKKLVSETVQESVKAVIESEQAKQNAEQIKSLEEKIETLTKAQEEMKSAKVRKPAIDANQVSGKVPVGDHAEEVKSMHFDALEFMKRNPNSSVQIKSFGQRAEEKQKLFLGADKKEVKMYNSFSGVDGGYGAQPANFLGTVNINQLAYAPVLSLARQVTTNLNGQQYLTFDPSKITVNDNKEGVPAKQGGKITLGEVLINVDEMSDWVPISNRLIDMNSDGVLRYDIIGQHEAFLNKALERKASNKMMEYLKSEAKKETFAKYETGITDKITIDDIMELLTVGLKDQYLMNAVLFTNRQVQLQLAQEKGSNGQYIWRDIFRSSSAGITRLDSPVGSLTIVGISDKADNKFDDYIIGGENTGKVVGIMADFNELIYAAYRDGFRVMELERFTQVDGYHRLYERTYFGQGIVNREAGVSIVIK